MHAYKYFVEGDIGVRGFAVLALFCLGFSEFWILKLGFITGGPSYQYVLEMITRVFGYISRF